MHMLIFLDGVYSPVQLANKLKLYREQKGWTQTDIAKRIGVKQSTISNFENHPDKTQLATLFKIVQAMEVVLQVHLPFPPGDELKAANDVIDDEDNW